MGRKVFGLKVASVFTCRDFNEKTRAYIAELAEAETEKRGYVVSCSKIVAEIVSVAARRTDMLPK
jgi:hypothetical protein